MKKNFSLNKMSEICEQKLFTDFTQNFTFLTNLILLPQEYKTLRISNDVLQQISLNYL